MNKKGFAPIITVIIIAAIAIASIGGYFLGKNKQQGEITPITTTLTTSTTLIKRILPTTSVTKSAINTTITTKFTPPTSWTIFRDKVTGFTFNYPGDIKTDYLHFPQAKDVKIIDCNNGSYLSSQCPSADQLPIEVRSQIGTIGIEDLMAQGGWGKKRIINNVTFCQYGCGDSAMGKTGIDTYDITWKNNKCILIHWIDVFPKCSWGQEDNPVAIAQCKSTVAYEKKLEDQVLSTFHFLSPSGN